ncbi:MAG: imelysin family protein [Deltaproteobacteria bacterium]
MRKLAPLIVLLLAGCSDPVTQSTVDREALVLELADAVIIPSYDDLAAEASDLERATSTLCETRTSTALDAARAAWKDVRRPWRIAEAYELGPVRDLRIKNAVEFLPLREDDLLEVLNGDAPIDATYISGLGVAARGLPVLEYLLWEGDVAAALGDTAPSRRCLYIDALAADLVTQSNRLADAWKGEGYRMEFAAEGSMAVDDLVNSVIEVLQLLEGERLALPLGRRDGGVPQLDAIEVRRSGAALADVRAGLEGVAAVYTGDYGSNDSGGIEALVAGANPTLDQRILGQIAASRAALDRVTEPLSAAIVDSPTLVEDAFIALRALLRLVAADLASQLGVTTTFSDNDGD